MAATSVPFTLRWFEPETAPFDYINFTDNSSIPGTAFKGSKSVVPSQRIATNIIPLPNGVKYDVNQTYDATKILDKVTVVFVVYNRNVGSNTFIEGIYTDAYKDFGRRGYLSGFVEENAGMRHVRALCRFENMTREMIGRPPYDHTQGRGLDNRAIQLTLVFDMLEEFQTT